MTELVLRVVRFFLGDHGVKTIAAHNSAARLLMGRTMHSAGKMTRRPSMSARHLKPNSRLRKALESEWCNPFLLLRDELSLAGPLLLAGVSRGAFHGRARLLDLKPDSIL